MMNRLCGRMQDVGCEERGELFVGPLSLGVRAFALLVVCYCASSSLATDVKLRERVIPKTSVVRLGDVAEITSADRQEARQLAAVPLMPAPAPSTQQFLRGREVADMLEANGIELKNIRFHGAEQVAIVGRSTVQPAAFAEAPTSGGEPVNRHAAVLAGGRASVGGQQISVDQAQEINSQLCQIVGEYVKSKTTKADTSRIVCNLNERQIALLAGAIDTPQCSGGSEPWTGQQKFLVSFKTAKGREQFLVFTDVAQLVVPVVVAVRPVARGSVVTAADVEIRQLDLSAKGTSQRVAFDNTEAVIGKEARQALQAGNVVFADQIQSPVLVKRGEVITVGAQSGGIRVRTSAKALQEGSQGELIQVESLDAKQRYDARVVGFREATVFSAMRVDTPTAEQKAAAEQRAAQRRTKLKR